MFWDRWLPKKFTKKKTRYSLSSDASDRRRFVSALKSFKPLGTLYTRGVRKRDGFGELVCDVFCAFYGVRPRLAWRFRLTPQARENRKILKRLLKCRAFRDARVHTCLNVEESAQATWRFFEGMEDELGTGGSAPLEPPVDGDFEEASRHLSDEEVSEEASDGDVPHGSSEGVDSSRAFSEHTHEEDEEGIGEEPGDEEDLSPELAARVESVVTEIATALDSESALESLFALGAGKARGQRIELDPKHRFELSKRFGERLRDFAKLVGRYRRMALGAHERRAARLPEEVIDVTLGDDLKWALPSERALLAHRALRYDLLRRLANGQVLRYELAGKEPQGRGPIVLCLDTSGSMAGESELQAKAIGLALLEVAITSRRSFVGILFSSASEKAVFPFPRNEPPDPNQALLFAATFFGGGTDFETPLAEAISWLGRDEYKKGDVVFLSDGYASLSEAFLNTYRSAKTEKAFKTFSVLIGEETGTPDVLREISDRIVRASRLDEAVAGDIFEAM